MVGFTPLVLFESDFLFARDNTHHAFGIIDSFDGVGSAFSIFWYMPHVPASAASAKGHLALGDNLAR